MSVIRRPAVGADDPHNRIAQQGSQRHTRSLGMDQIDRYRCGRGQPQPTALSGLFPARLIDVLDRSLPDLLQRLRVSLSQGGTGLHLQRVQGSHRDFDPEHLLGDLLQTPTTHLVGADQVAESGSELREGGVSEILSGNGSPSDVAAVRASASVALVFGDENADRREFGNLVSKGRRIVRLVETVEWSLAAGAVAGDVHNDLVDLVEGQELTGVSGVSRLPAGLAGRLGLDDRSRSGRRIGRRRGRRIAGVLVEASFELGETSLQFGQLLTQEGDFLIAFSTARAGRFAHAFTLRT